jgi:hypothetical protein
MSDSLVFLRSIQTKSAAQGIFRVGKTHYHKKMIEKSDILLSFVLTECVPALTLQPDQTESIEEWQ